MFATDPTFLQKLWGRGVDIAVGVATSVIVAAIGLLFWWGKLRLDLHKAKLQKLQDQDLDELFERKARRRDFDERYERLDEQREIFASDAEHIANAHTGRQGDLALADLWESYVRWLESNGLDNLQSNLAMLNTHRPWAVGIRGGGHSQRPAFLETAGSMARMIRETELPGELG